MTESSLLIRPATAADLPAVLALYAQPDMDDGDVLPVPEAERLFARFVAYPDYTLYVVEDGPRVVGTFALLVMDNLGHRGAPSAIVEDVMVAPDVQGGGVGQRMMGFAVARAREKGCYKLMLSSNLKRERAHIFYEKLGFERHGYSFRVDLGANP
ncbi:GNAT family N-acetyltransferase [Xanthobacteraceae bacterium Astr-EGSB]|uniref:GNAT family N-acetyltransferase n=1 Tax=Astrobacterium formosum TaxID=3069710 RepID=UPI0027B26B42|nr:GNAT family N-acetyltransferase [Xanthobacteraceae bacterium Astr-EGSB]